MLVRVRDDDVLVHSRAHPDPFKKFKSIHEWTTLSDRVIHVPTIIAESIQEFPECVEYCKEQTALGQMEPEIHGWQHIDYGKLPHQEARDHIERARDWIAETLDYTPKYWYTPWGASQPHLHEVAAELGVKLIDCSNLITLEGPQGVIAKLSRGLPIEALDGVELFLHWWAGGLRLLRFCKVMEAGSWNAAFEADPELFRG